MLWFLKFLENDWFLALALPVAGIGLAMWRLFLNVRGNTAMNEFIPLFQERLDHYGEWAALSLCRKRTDLIPRYLFVAGLEANREGLAAVRLALDRAIEHRIRPQLNCLLPSIRVIAKAATSFGLFVTVLSILTINANGANAAARADALAIALFGTAMGLCCAIPLVFTHILLKAWVARFEAKLKEAARVLMLLLVVRGL